MKKVLFSMMCLMALSMSTISAQDFKKSIPDGYVDLGLPSGTLWKDKNEEGFFSYEQALGKFGSRLPTLEQFEELRSECRWKWTGRGYKVTGPNGNSIFLLAGKIYHHLDYIVGVYWSSTPEGKEDDDVWILFFEECCVCKNLTSMSGNTPFFVRLVQN